MATISLRELSKVYATGVTALDGLTLEVDDGEFVALVGPSGCGKTTAPRLVAGLERVTSGTISFGGRVVNETSPRHRDVAMVFQDYALYPHLTVYQNIGFALENKKVDRAERDGRIRAVPGCGPGAGSASPSPPSGCTSSTRTPGRRSRYRPLSAGISHTAAAGIARSFGPNGSVLVPV